MNRRKILQFCSLLIMLLILPSCSKSNVTSPSGNQNASDSEDTDSNTDSDPAIPDDESILPDTNTEDNAPTGIVSTSEDNETVTPSGSTPLGTPSPIRDISSSELVKEIHIGWNLGNTLDAVGGTGISSETSWGNPKTTKAMIDTMKEAGFNTLRVPTTWESHLGPAPDYTIDTAWLDRVQEVVDYGIDNEMFVILNLHHEEWYSPTYDNEETAITILTKVWAQIADRFQNYDEHLIFEGLNEPRQKGTANEWNGGDKEGWEVLNHFNEAFVETIRKAGGNNPLRHLMIPPYAASASTKAWDSFIIPKDDKIIVSIHAYSPYDFALNTSGTSKWSADSSSDTKEITELLDNIDNYFISKGQPVIIGEFGAVNKDNLKERSQWADFFVKSAKGKGIPCIWWDNGSITGSGELFGLLDRNTLTFPFQEIIDSLITGVNN